MATEKKWFRYSRCNKKTGFTDAKRAEARLCVACAPDLAPLPAKAKKPAEASRPVVTAVAPAKGCRVAVKHVAPSKGRKSAALTAVPSVAVSVDSKTPEALSHAVKGRKPAASVAKAATPAVTPVIAPKPGSPVAEAKLAAPSAEAVALDQLIAETREAMNRLATDLSAKRIELAGLREQRRALGPLPRSRRDPDAPKKVTLLDAAALVLAEVAEPMKAKSIWQAIVEQSLWSTPNGGKTPFATLAATMTREIADRGAGSRFAKAGRGLFGVNPAGVA